MTIKAKYEKGVFKPLEEVRLKDGTVVEVLAPTEKAKRRSVRDFSFAGMWKSRKDIPDGRSYVNRLRGKPWPFPTTRGIA
ncbi:MAG: antitoxin family protein [Acidobacteria bacterium]|nr:antitoxin family protein [Acidobacteriota bacterium]